MGKIILRESARQMAGKSMNEREDMERNSALNEGIDFDPETRTVSYNPSHEDNVDTSVENNPTVSRGIFPRVPVWSIFKRKRGLESDGNPLIYALKGEGWTFRSEEDRIAIEKQIDAIATKFARMYKIGITVLMPSGNALNKHIADIVLSKSRDGELLEGPIWKLTTMDVDIMVRAADSKFRAYYKDDFDAAYRRLETFLDKMDEERIGYFTRHMITDSKMRDVLDFTFKVSQVGYADFARKINGQHILLIDDTISRGQTIRDACAIMRQSYAPKSMTVLTLLSRLD